MRYWFLVLIIFALGLVLSATAVAYWISGITPVYYFSSHTPRETLFDVQAIDTMKYSRDMARQEMYDKAFDATIDAQMQRIKEAGATHVAVGTPYDPEFLPYLKRWVMSAREHHLSVWFRGNFAGWEGWFAYGKITPEEHKEKLTEFLAANSDLFADGDIFTPCPECENGGPGDPRQTGEVDTFNSFLVEEKGIADWQFLQMHKTVSVYYSMNGDIARSIITPLTARRLGGTILVDHYTKGVAQFEKDIPTLGKRAQANIGFGEFGAPIPDLQGKLSDGEQSEFVEGLLHALYLNQNVVHVVNYWTLAGGSAALLRDGGGVKPAYAVVQNFYTAPSVYGDIRNSIGEPLQAHVTVADAQYAFDTKNSFYQVFLPKPYRTFTIAAEGYIPATMTIDGAATSSRKDFYLEPISPSFGYKVRAFIEHHL